MSALHARPRIPAGDPAERLLAALRGIGLTPDERRLLEWVADMGGAPSADTLARLILRIRVLSDGAPALPEAIVRRRRTEEMRRIPGRHEGGAR
ncbi:hypothetical protein GCM10027294_25330 [Marinactinospora endophytica]